MKTETALNHRDMTLAEKHEKAADLYRQLSRSVDLENSFPGIFNLGGAKTRIFSRGNRGRPMFRLTRGDGSVEEMPLVNAPTALIRHHKELIYGKAAPSMCEHKDWRVAAKAIQ